MVDMIKELYSNIFYDEFDSKLRKSSEEYDSLCRRDTELWKTVQPILGIEMIDKLNTSAADLSRVENLEWFRAGFRLGAALMLELR